jgi:hypothetical protein
MMNYIKNPTETRRENYVNREPIMKPVERKRIEKIYHIIITITFVEIKKKI